MQESLRILESISDRYAHGDCGAFALACARRYSAWTLVVFESDEELVHVACEADAGVYFDAYGYCTLTDVVARYNTPDLRWRKATCAEVEQLGGGTSTLVLDALAHLDVLLVVLQELGAIEVTPANPQKPPVPTKATRFNLAFAAYREEVYSMLVPLDCGPFDGGCLICAKALQIALDGGDLVSLVRADDSADHVAVLYAGLLWDLAGPMSPVKFLDRFNLLEHFGVNRCTDVRALHVTDVPEALRDSALVYRLATILKKILPLI